MKTVVYIDSLFLMNFIINMILLKLTDVFSSSQTKTPKICLASSIGALYAVCMFFPNISFLYILPFKMLMSFFIVYITDTKTKLIPLIKKCAVFYLVSFTLAGVLIATYFVSFKNQSIHPVIQNGIVYFDISPFVLLVASFLSILIIWLSSAIFSRNKNLGLKSLKIYLGDKGCDMQALSDTGNLLKEPISNLPVIIVEKSFIEPLFPSGIPNGESNFSTEIKLRLIPYSSVGCKSSIMTGFVPDKILFDGNKEIKAVIGISDDSLSATKEYGALFNPLILKSNRR
ncbi:MAG: hypothetical protein E7394_07795 [Ruminococcaceae bacterium]|nr:hypothetical protein [Oscillospiraceae bacterium]